MTFSIGDVLEQLSEDFPDITVSKIRFLESQGLIAPMRTASGFRMFSQADVTKLKWILVLQRDRFLPLKVIKEFLSTLSEDAFADGHIPNFDFENSGTLPLNNGETRVIDIREDTSEQEIQSAQEMSNEGVLATVSQLPSHRNNDDHPNIGNAMLVQEAPTRTKTVRKMKPTIVPQVYDSMLAQLDTKSLVGSTESMPSKKVKNAKKVSHNEAVISLEAMSIESGISPPELKELVKFGVLEGTGTGNAIVFHRDEIAMALTVAPLLKHGLEPRHIKNYVLFASREVGFLEHIIQDDLRRKNPESLEIAREKAKQFIQDTARLKEMLLIKSLETESQNK